MIMNTKRPWIHEYELRNHELYEHEIWKKLKSSYEPYELYEPGILEAVSKFRHIILISVGKVNPVEPLLNSALNTAQSSLQEENTFSNCCQKH